MGRGRIVWKRLEGTVKRGAAPRTLEIDAEDVGPPVTW
jgi:hypothetical protein